MWGLVAGLRSLLATGVVQRGGAGVVATSFTGPLLFLPLERENRKRRGPRNEVGVVGPAPGIP